MKYKVIIQRTEVREHEFTVEAHILSHAIAAAKEAARDFNFADGKFVDASYEHTGIPEPILKERRNARRNM